MAAYHSKLEGRSTMGALSNRLYNRLHRSEACLRLLDAWARRRPHRPTAAARASRGGTELHTAIAHGDPRRAAELLWDGIDAGATDDAGHTALSPDFSRPDLDLPPRVIPPAMLPTAPAQPWSAGGGA